MKVSRSLGLVAGIALVVGVSVVPAGASVVNRGHYSGTDSFTYNNCGYPVEVQSEFSGTFRVREGKNGDESAFFVSDNYSYREVHTNLDTGEWFVVRGNGLFTDVKATRVEGSIFEFVTVEAGQPFVVEDSAGMSCFVTEVQSATGSCSTLSATTSREGRWSSF